MHFKEELLDDLEIGKLYTERQLKIFTVNNHEAIIVSQVPYLDLDGQRLFKIKEIQEVFVHTGSDGVYNIPQRKIKLISLSEEL